MKYLKYLKGARIYALLAPILMILEVVMELYQPEIFSEIIDIGIVEGAGTKYIVTKGLIMLLYAFVGVLGGVGCCFCATRASLVLGYNLREDMFKKIQEFSFADIDSFSGASLVTRLTNDVVMMQTITAMALRMFIRAPMIFFGGVYHAIVINRTLALILCVSIPLILSILFVTLRLSFPLFKKAQDFLDKVNAVIQENLTGIRVVKAYNRANHENDRFGKANLDYVEVSVKAQKIITFMMPAITLVMNLSIVAVVFIGSKLSPSDDVAVGGISAFITYITRILFALMMISMMLTILSRASASSERIQEVLNKKVEITSPENPTGKVTKGKVEFKNVTFRYEGAGEKPAVSNISFTAEGGETIAVLGSTGSGKSTIVNLIPRLYDVTDGEVLIDGVNVKDYDLYELRNSIGMVLQDVLLFSGTVEENIKWGNKYATREEVINAAKMAQAHTFIEERGGYDCQLTQDGTNFSGGQKQRISIARALIKKPKILILDDSTSAVDTQTEAKIRESYSKELGDMTVFIIAQRISSVMWADKIIVMENGSIVDIGKHDELMEKSEVYREIYDSQRGKED